MRIKYNRHKAPGKADFILPKHNYFLYLIINVNIYIHTNIRSQNICKKN